MCGGWVRSIWKAQLCDLPHARQYVASAGLCPCFATRSPAECLPGQPLQEGQGKPLSSLPSPDPHPSSSSIPALPGAASNSLLTAL